MDVEAEGMTPQTGVEYTFRVRFDCTAGTYSAGVKTGAMGFARQRGKGGRESVPLASSGFRFILR